jgi:ABC-2 type transport system permease protein
LIARLEQSDSVRPKLVTLEQAEKQLSARQASAALIIPGNLTLEELKQGSIALEFRQQPNNMNALIASQAISVVIRRVSSAVDIASGAAAEAESLRPFESEAEQIEFTNAALQAAQDEISAAPNRVEAVVGQTPDGIDYDPASSSSAGQLITWVFIPLLGISGTFAYERQQGTLRRLLTTPTEKSIFLLGTITGQVLMALVQMALLIGFGILVMKLNWGQSPAGLAVMMVSSALAAAALGTTLGTFVKSEGQASGLSIMLGMVMALLGGCWYPIELFPTAVQTAVQVLPTRWAMQGMLNLVQRGQGLEQILPQAAVLLGFALVFFVIGILRFRYE